MNIALSKKTKAELIADYETLLARQKELESATKSAFSEKRTEQVEKAKKEHSLTSIDKTAESLRAVAMGAIVDFTSSLEAQVRRFEEL
jgi:hypothetical protein